MQRILWRPNTAEPICEYVLNTVTYGVNSASFLATECLEKIADDCPDPLIAKLIRNQFYLDDMGIGSDPEEVLILSQKNIHKMLAKHGFLLREYCSNSKKVM